MVSADERYKAVDFFCGGGGLTYGLRQAGIDVIAGVDLDTDAKETYEINNPGSRFINADITELSLTYFEENFDIKINNDNMIFAGCSPCQFYSLIPSFKNKSKATKDLLLHFQKFVEYYRPGYVLVENVPGIMNNKETVLNDFLQKQSTMLVRENQMICIEDLNVKGMIRNHKLAKSIASVSWSRFFTMLEYKAGWYGSTIIRVPTIYPSSQTCSCCGYQNPLVKNLSVRSWECPECHTVHNIDTNASINILNKGLSIA